MDRSLREAVAVSRGRAIINAAKVVRGGPRGPYIAVEALEGEVRDTIEGLKDDPDTKQAQKPLATMLKYLTAVQRGFSDVGSDWSRTMDAFRRFRGEIEDKSLESRFNVAMKAMHQTGLGEKR